MIRTEIITDFRALIDARLFLQAFPGLLEDRIVAVINREIRPGFLNELRHYPPPAKHPFEFETEKSRRYYFWMVSQGKIKTVNGRYQRTGKLAKAWDVGVSVDDELAVISAQNRTKYEKYVTGKRQVAGHRNTGWVRSQRTIDFWTDAAVEVATRAVVDLLKHGKF